MTLAAIDRYDERRISTCGDHAIVVGGSVAGLAAARVLADAFERVTVLEKDSVPDQVGNRPGVPQGNHIHVLQESGRSTLEDLLPGYCEDLLTAGGVLIDGASDINFYDEGDYLADGPFRMPAYSASRPLFEAVLRRRVREVDGVTLRVGSQVTDYLTEDGDERVTGVTVRQHRGETDELSGDLVVDATGRASRTPSWLRAHGYPTPPLAEVEIHVGYSSFEIERPPADRRAYLDIPSPPHTRGGSVFPIENDRWLVTLNGVHDDDPPTDLSSVSDFADTLVQDEISALLDTQPVVSEDVSYYPFPSSRRRHYETVDRFPEGLVVIGDAIASFNPIYGQGMSVASLQALVLHHAIADGGLDDLGRRFFARAAPVIDVAWQLAVVADHAFPETTGPKPRGADLFNWYLTRLTRKAQADGSLRAALFSVIAMEEPPETLLRPATAWKVLRPEGVTQPRETTRSVREFAGALSAAAFHDSDTDAKVPSANTKSRAPSEASTGRNSTDTAGRVGRRQDATQSDRAATVPNQ